MDESASFDLDDLLTEFYTQEQGHVYEVVVVRAKPYATYTVHGGEIVIRPTG